MSNTMNEAVGTSDNLSFDEALRDALKKLPPQSNEAPQKLTLEEIVYQAGDIAGRRHLSVRIRRVGM